MQYVLTLVALVFSLVATAQQGPWQPTFPYNPDGDGDGYISLNDMLDFLVVYGQEYPGAFYSDTTRAILDLGSMSYSKCYRTANELGPKWRMLTQHDFHNWFHYLLVEGQSEFEMDASTNFQGSVQLTDGDPGYFRFKYSQNFESEIDGQNYNVSISSNDSYLISTNDDGAAGRLYAFTNSRCFVVSEVRPQLQYHVVIRSSITDFNETVTDSLNAGWNLQGGAVINWSGTTSQTLWKWND